MKVIGTTWDDHLARIVDVFGCDCGFRTIYKESMESHNCEEWAKKKRGIK